MALSMETLVDSKRREEGNDVTVTRNPRLRGTIPVLIILNILQIEYFRVVQHSNLSYEQHAILTRMVIYA
jgi:hypothetical protein